MSLKSINPSTGKLINKYQEYSDNNVALIIDDVSNNFLNGIREFVTMKTVAINH
jgi:hypothetical protein